MSCHLTDKQRLFRDKFILANYKHMNVNQIAKKFDVATSTICAVCLRLGVKAKPIPRQKKGSIKLPTEGKLSGTKPTYMEMQEYHAAQPHLDPYLMVFWV